ncbi:MAG TPA: alpha/beta hydrolase [Pyrinomonadaceae bacterium]|nr:alpha/beta hydrolase [Pyrinomonadaceae bacterium]
MKTKNKLPLQTEKIERIWTNVNGLKIHALAARNPGFADKTPFVLIHGLAISNRYLIPVMTELAKRREVFAPDLPGWGDSSKPRRVFNITELADALADWMKAQGIERADIVGHSLGSQIAAEFAVRNPEMVEKLILASATFEKGKRNFFRQFWRFLINAPREPFSLVYIALRDYFKFGIRREIYTLKYSLNDKIEEKLPQIAAPTLVLSGEFDTVAPQNWIETMAELLPNGKAVIIPAGTHGVIYQSHEKFAAAVCEFVDC